MGGGRGRGAGVGASCKTVIDGHTLFIYQVFELSCSVISYDLISAFDEILQMGRDQEVDFVLLGGDLFHDNRPTRNAEHQCMKILKKHVLGDR